MTAVIKCAEILRREHASEETGSSHVTIAMNLIHIYQGANLNTLQKTMEFPRFHFVKIFGRAIASFASVFMSMLQLFSKMSI